MLSDQFQVHKNLKFKFACQEFEANNVGRYAKYPININIHLKIGDNV